MPSASPTSRAGAVRNKASAMWVGSASRRERVRERKSAVLSFKVIVRPAKVACFKRAETRSHSGHRACARATASASSSGGVVSAQIECAKACALTPRSSPPRAKAEPCACGCGHSGPRVHAPRAWQAGRLQRSRHRLVAGATAAPNPPPQPRDRLVGETDGCLAPGEHRKAARLVEIKGELGEELGVAQPDRHGDR
jgi:hypothetical protein